jgi:hypothetical protein
MIMLVPLARLDPKGRVLQSSVLAAVYREKPPDVNREDGDKKDDAAVADDSA